MKTMHHGWAWSVLAAVLVVMMLAGGGGVTAYGAPTNLYWDANGATAGTGGTGPWNLTDSTWRTNTATGALMPWDNGINGNWAYLAGTVGTLTLGDNVTVAYLSASSGYVINGDAGGLYKLTFDSTSMFAGGSYTVMMNGGGVTINAPVVLTGTNMDFRSTMTFNGAISNAPGSSAGFVANSGGIVTLNAASPAFSGGFVGGSTLIIGHDQAAGTGVINPPATSLQAGNGNRTISNRIAPSGGSAFVMTIGGTNNLTLAGGAGTGIVGGNGATITVGNPVLTIDRPIFSYPTGSYGKDFPGFTKAGTGTLVLAQSAAPTLGLTSGVNINSGAVIVNGQAYAATSFSATTTLNSAQIACGSTANLHIGQNMSAGTGYADYTAIVSIDDATHFSVASAWKASTTQTLTACDAAGLGSSCGHITVSNGATLGGTGMIVMATGKTNTILAGGTIAPGSITAGAEVGTLTFTNGTFVLSTNALYAWQYKDGVGDKVRVYGTLALPAVATVNVSQVSGALPATPTLFTATTLTGASDLSGWVVNGLPTYSAKVQGNDVILQAAPLAITNLAPTIADSSHATLSGKLLGDGGSQASVWVFWGPEDKGQTKDGWANTNALGPCTVGVTLSTNVLLTPPSGSYSYRFYASNAVGTEAWSATAQTFTVESVTLAATQPNAAELGSVPGVVTATRTTAATNVPLQINFTVGSTATEGADYAAIGTSVTIPVGATNANITITPVLERVIEGTETVTVTLAAGSYLIGSPSPVIVTIADWTNPPPYACVASTGDNTCGTNWATAYTNVQYALNLATSNFTVYLKGETLNLPLNSDNGRLVWTQSWVSILGGYAGDASVPGALAATPTVFANTNAANYASNRVLYVSGVTNGTLSRVIIRGGEVGNRNPQTLYTHQYGGGVFMTGCTNMLFDTVTLDGNYIGGQQSCNAFGFGMYAANSYGLLTNCVIRNNTSSGLWTLWYGGGLHLAGGGWQLRDCVARDNGTVDKADYPGPTYGMGVYINGGTHSMVNCLLSRNYGYTSPGLGEGVYVAAGNVALGNVTMAFHPHEGLRLASGTAGVTNSIFWGNGTYDIVGVGTGAVAFTDIGSGDRAFTNNANLSADPLFERGLYLAANSPCANTGNVSAAAAGLNSRTTRADGTLDTHAAVDLGYHQASGVAVPELYVSVNSGNDGNTGTAPGAGNAFKTIGKALATAGDGTHIHVEAGNYTTNTEVFPLAVSKKWGVQLLGTNSALTVLSAQGASARALTMSFCYPDARIEGLTLANASWSMPATLARFPVEVGGALFLDNAGVTVASCAVTNNALTNPNDWTYPAGGGIYANYSDVLMSNCVVRGNSCTPWYAAQGFAGGVYASGIGRGTFVNCEFTGNKATQGSNKDLLQGGALYLNGNVTLRNCLISSNDAVAYTGGVAPGDGAYVAGGAVVFENCTIVTNGGEGINRAAGTVAVTNSILWANGVDATGTVTAAYSDIGVAGPAVTLVSCLSTNPLFVFPATNNYRLAEGSPCINTGLTLSWMTGATDLGGNRRIMAGRVDMGAYEAMPPGGTVFKLR